MNPLNESFEEFKIENAEDLSWNEVNHLMPIGKVVEVMDPISKIRWRMKRTYGKLHADMEPLDQSDTNAIKKAFGLADNYNDAPYHKVIVKIDERYIIGAFMTFPHQGSDKHEFWDLVDPNELTGYSTDKDDDAIHPKKKLLPNMNSIKDNGVVGHMCLYFKGSSQHTTWLPNKKIDRVINKNL